MKKLLLLLLLSPLYSIGQMCYTIPEYNDRLIMGHLNSLIVSNEHITASGEVDTLVLNGNMVLKGELKVNSTIILNGKKIYVEKSSKLTSNRLLMKPKDTIFIAGELNTAPASTATYADVAPVFFMRSYIAKLNITGPFEYYSNLFWLNYCNIALPLKPGSIGLFDNGQSLKISWEVLPNGNSAYFNIFKIEKDGRKTLIKKVNANKELKYSTEIEKDKL